MAIKQTFFCPYLGESVTDEMTSEHVFSDSLGCPNSYCISVSKSANSSLSNTFEQKFLRSSRVLYLCNGLKVSRRNKDPEKSGKRAIPDWTTRFDAHLPNAVQSHQLIRSVEGEDFIRATNAKIVDPTPIHGPNVPKHFTVVESGTIRGQESDLQKLMDGIEGKNPGRVIWGKVETHPIQKIEYKWEDDPAVIHKFLSKVQFAVALKEFSSYELDPAAERFRSLLFRKAIVSNVVVLNDPDRMLLRVLLPNLRQFQHGVAFYSLPNGCLLSVAAMFGGDPYYQACLISDSAANHLPFGQALEVRCHAIEREIEHIRGHRNPVAVQKLVNITLDKEDFIFLGMALL